MKINKTITVHEIISIPILPKYIFLYHYGVAIPVGSIDSYPNNFGTYYFPKSTSKYADHCTFNNNCTTSSR